MVNVSTQDNAKLLKQLEFGFKREVKWNKYLSKPELLAQNKNLNHLGEPKFQGVNRRFENNTQRATAKAYYLLNVELKDYNVMIDGKIYLINQ